MRSLLALVLLPALALTACGGGGDSPNAAPADLGQEFVLRHGETVDVGPLTLKFVAVTEETRCAINVMCVRAGNARIQLAATSRNHSDLFELGIPEGPAVEYFDSHVIELIDLDPVPTYPYPVPSPDTYRATLVVDGQVTINGG